MIFSCSRTCPIVNLTAMILAGEPATTAYGGIGLVTTDLAPTTAPRPISHLFRRTHSAPIQQSSFIVIPVPESFICAIDRNCGITKVGMCVPGIINQTEAISVYFFIFTGRLCDMILTSS